MQGIHWFDNDSVDLALAEARRLKRALLVDFWDPTCLGCAKLFAVTYRADSVQCAIETSFVALKYDTTRPNARYRELNGRAAHSWHPHILIADDWLIEGRRFSGYLNPAGFVAQLNLGLGTLHLYHRRYALAHAAFRRALAPGTSAGIAAEAMYWEGVAAYRVSRDFSRLREAWERLRAEHPESDWAIRADCLDVAIPSDGFRSDDPDSVQLLADAPVLAPDAARTTDRPFPLSTPLI